jgi:hypothetical protein
MSAQDAEGERRENFLFSGPGRDSDNRRIRAFLDELRDTCPPVLDAAR